MTARLHPRGRRLKSAPFCGLDFDGTRAFRLFRFTRCDHRYGNLTPAEITPLSHIPILIIYGDFAATSPITTSCQTEISQITAAGGDIHFAWLPNLTPGSLYTGSPGPITGNDHMMMLDNNNQQIARQDAVAEAAYNEYWVDFREGENG
jgi:pimeloyl-ACP methyl ester carboxylesterase